MKRWIHASTLWDQGWSKRLNKETGETYFVYTCPKATAYVFQSNEKDDNGEYNSSAEVGFTKDMFKNKINKSFFGRGSEFDAMTWAEKVIFDE